MLKRVVGYIKKVLGIGPTVPEQVDIEVSTACNMDCRMCKRRKLDFGDEHMSFEMFRSIVDRLPSGVKTISFGGYGEMTINPRFFDMVRYAKSRGYRTETTSNGVLLKDADLTDSLLSSGLDVFRVSIEHVRSGHGCDGVGHAFSKDILDGLRQLSRLRRQKRKQMMLAVNCVVHEENIREVPGLIRFAADAGLDLVELLRLDTCSNDAQRLLHRKKEKKLYRRIERMDKGIKVVTPANRFSGIRRLYNPGGGFCLLRYQCAHITIDGTVTPCAFGFAKKGFGNIKENNLKKIWQSRRFRRIRKNERNKTCRSCALFKWN
ncbi:radical SAM protein [Candidatus Woesearchaeota archaeon]|nr:radical SAM protein [Candidatus Woesearchaeota archaeon]